MESRIKIKATLDEIDNAFEHNEIFSVRYFSQISKNRFKVIIRHKELEERLEGSFTIPELEELLA